MGAVDEIAAERQRQIDAEGWSADHDDGHDNRELATAAACYCLGLSHVEAATSTETLRVSASVRLWPWDMSWWKLKGRRRDLVRAGALIIAEIERLDRETAKRDAAVRGTINAN